MRRVSTFVTYEELTGRRVSLEDLRRELKKFSRASAVFVPASLNVILGSGGGMDWNAHEAFLKHLFTSEQLGAINARRKLRDETRFVIHRSQLLLVIKEAFRVCDASGIDATQQPCLAGFGIVLLMANDLLRFRSSGATKRDDQLSVMAELIPVNEYASRESSMLTDMSRAIVMSTTIQGRLRSRAEYVDIDAEYLKASGVTASQYRALCFGLLSVYITLDHEKFLRAPSSFFMKPETWRQNIALPPDVADRFIQRVSGEPDAISSLVREKDCGPFDFDSIRRYPLHASDGVYFALDTLFLAEKLQMGYFFEVLHSLPRARRKELLNFWGLVFEEYAHWLMEPACNAPENVYVASPRFEDSGEEVCDAIIISGADACFIEYKANLFKSEAKFSGDLDALRKEIELKLVGTKEKRKGVSQLVNAIESVFRRKGRRMIRNVDLSGVRTIYPLLVTRDDIGGGFVINTWLNERYQKQINKKLIRPFRSTPLFVLSIADIEMISPYLRDTSLVSILYDRYKVNPALGAPFSALEIPSMMEKGVRRNHALEREFTRATDAAAAELFPRSKLQHVIGT